MGNGGDNSQVHAETSPKKISVGELNQHRTPQDAWVSFRGKVYDVSGWYDHPGGSVIFSHAGDDCTDVFAAFHPASAMKDLHRFEIGELDENIKIPSPESDRKVFEKGYRDLRAKIFALGLFNASPLFYVYKCTSNLLLLALSALCVVCSSSLWVHMIGAILLGVFWQQCGWLAHDFLHHQVFKSRVLGDLAGIVIGNVFQGFSVHWWKTKHNTHHAVPNLEASCPDAADGDPDIDTMPILAWTMRMAESARESKWSRFLINWQPFLYFPVLLFARLAWAHQSWVFVWGGAGQHSVKEAQRDRERIGYPALEKAGLIVHYAWLLLLLSYMPVLHAVAFFIVAQTSCGLFLATVFGLGHNGMAVYPANERPDWWTLQVSTTRNISSNWFVDWFCGGLQYQVDHHLFPMIPRHNLKKVNVLVESLCKEHGVSYHKAGMLVGTIEVLQHLSKISTEFIKEFPAM